MIKLLLFGAVLYLLYRQTANLSFNNFHLTISKTAIAAAFLLFQIRYILMGVRIYYSAALQGVSVSIRACIALVYRTWFMAFIMPLPDSEDIFKFLFFKNRQVPANKTLQIIFYDRIGALLALLFIGVCSLLLVLYTGQAGYFSNAVIVPLAAIVLISIAALTHRWWLKKLVAVLRLFKNSTINRTAQLLEGISQSAIPAKVILVAFILSMLYHLCAFGIILILLQIPFNLAQWAAIALGIPLFYISAIVPLSYQGLGLYETAMFAYLVFLKIPAVLVMQVAVLHLIFEILLILTGGVFFLMQAEKMNVFRLFKGQ